MPCRNEVIEQLTIELETLFEIKCALIRDMAQEVIPNPIAGLISTDTIHQAINQYCDAVLGSAALIAESNAPPACLGQVDRGGTGVRNLRSGPGLEYSVVDTINNLSQVEICEVQRANLEVPDNIRHPYWYRISTNEIGSAWITAEFISLLGDCNIYPVPSFGEHEPIATGPDSILPPPPPDEELLCIEGSEFGRPDCVTQVYAQFYQAFIDAYGEPPTLQDILALTFEVEMGASNLTPELLRAAVINHYINTCGDSCTGEELVMLFLSGVHGLYTFGRTEGLTPKIFDQLLFDAKGIRVRDIRDLPHYDEFASLLWSPPFSTLSGALVPPLQWGNYPYSNDPNSVYQRVLNDDAELRSRIFECEIERTFTTTTREDGKISIDTDTWTDTMFLVTSGGVGETSFEQDDVPCWVTNVYENEDELPVSGRQNCARWECR